jgi:ATP adenylyltransferase
MDHLWSPWRYQYVQKIDAPSACVFCEQPADNDDAKHFIIHRAELNFVLLNLYPYTTGHMMVVPFAHVPTLEAANEETVCEMMVLTQHAERCLRAVYRPRGFNIGMNIGECAGAGIAGHLHMHVLPRWPGDTNFLSTVAETRLMPEDLATTYKKLVEAWSTA